jgi:hypothetical protein
MKLMKVVVVVDNVEAVIVADKKILLEVWKTWNYIDLIGSFLLLPSLIALWHFNYHIGFWILLGGTIGTKIGMGLRVSKLEKRLKI